MMIKDRLFSLQDIAFRDFSAGLMPTVERCRVIGVKTPALRALARELIRKGEAESFLASLPHDYFEEDQLHAFLIGEIKDFDTALREVESFLPFIDNWATCDQLIPRAFAKEPRRLLPPVDRWLSSDKVYTVRFAIGLLMRHFLDDAFDAAYLDQVAAVRSEEYYINMMCAWYFATALAKQYEAAIPYLTEHRLPSWVHRKTIQKARESLRVTPAHKAFLKTLL